MNEHATNPMECIQTVSFDYHGIPFVPHYTERNIYVSPGNVMRSERELLVAGARRTISMLWPRAWSI